MACYILCICKSISLPLRLLWLLLITSTEEVTSRKCENIIWMFLFLIHIMSIRLTVFIMLMLIIINPIQIITQRTSNHIQTSEYSYEPGASVLCTSLVLMLRNLHKNIFNDTRGSDFVPAFPRYAPECDTVLHYGWRLLLIYRYDQMQDVKE